MNTYIDNCNHWNCDCEKVEVMKGFQGFKKKVSTVEWYEISEEEEDRIIKSNDDYFNSCIHIRRDIIDGCSFCVDCGLMFDNEYLSSFENVDAYSCKKTSMNKKLKVTAKEKKYINKMQEMFPDLDFPEGNVMFKYIEEMYKLRKEPGDKFPAIKNIIHFILTKHEMTDFANTIKISKSSKFEKLMEKLFKENIPTDSFGMFKYYLNKIRD